MNVLAHLGPEGLSCRMDQPPGRGSQRFQGLEVAFSGREFSLQVGTWEGPEGGENGLSEWNVVSTAEDNALVEGRHQTQPSSRAAGPGGGGPGAPTGQPLPQVWPAPAWGGPVALSSTLAISL